MNREEKIKAMLDLLGGDNCGCIPDIIIDMLYGILMTAARKKD